MNRCNSCGQEVSTVGLQAVSGMDRLPFIFHYWLNAEQHLISFHDCNYEKYFDDYLIFDCIFLVQTWHQLKLRQLPVLAVTMKWLLVACLIHALGGNMLFHACWVVMIEEASWWQLPVEIELPPVNTCPDWGEGPRLSYPHLTSAAVLAIMSTDLQAAGDTEMARGRLVCVAFRA